MCQKIVDIFSARPGAIAKISSIHVNGWFGGYDKLSTSRLFLGQQCGIDIDRDANSSRLRRRQPERCADVRLLRLTASASPMCWTSPATLPAAPGFVTPSRGAAGSAELVTIFSEARKKP